MQLLDLVQTFQSSMDASVFVWQQILYMIHATLLKNALVIQQLRVRRRLSLPPHVESRPERWPLLATPRPSTACGLVDSSFE